MDCIIRDIEWLGHSRVILKSDNEKAIVRVLKDSLGVLRVEGLHQVGEEHPPAYDPQANGAIEVTVQGVKGLARTMLHGLQRHLQRRIPPTHPVVTWLVRHAAGQLTRRVRGTDGMTPHQRV